MCWTSRSGSPPSYRDQNAPAQKPNAEGAKLWQLGATTGRWLPAGKATFSPGGGLALYPWIGNPMRTISRRRLTMMGGAAAALHVSTAQAARRRAWPGWPFGVQLWSVNAELEEDFDACLKRLGNLGYRRVEAAGWHGRRPEQFRRSVAAAGLLCDSAHVSMHELRLDAASAISRVRDLGCKYVICSAPDPTSPLVPGPDFLLALTRAMTLDAWKANAASLNEIAARATTAGLSLGYHNHAAEFALYDGRRAYDLLLAATDPKTVFFELDVAWAAAGGADPVQLLKAQPGRFVRLHLKDLRQPPPPGVMATSFATVGLGEGAIDWRAVLTAAEQAGVGGAYVELEPPHLRPPFEALAADRAYLTTI